MRLRRFPLAALEQLAGVKAVVDHDPVIVGRSAPAVGKRMLAEILDRVDVITVDLPIHLLSGVTVHRLFLVSGFLGDVSIGLRLATHKPLRCRTGGGLLGQQEKNCGAGLLGFIYRCERGKVI
jgi:hypothetical protein